MTRAERQRIAKLKRLLRSEHKAFDKLSKREAKLASELKAVRRRPRASENRVGDLYHAIRSPQDAIDLERIKELRESGLGLKESLAKAREEAAPAQVN